MATGQTWLVVCFHQNTGEAVRWYLGGTHGYKWWDLTSSRAQLPSVSSGWHVCRGKGRMGCITGCWVLYVRLGVWSLANIALWLRKEVMLLIWLDPIQLLVQVYGVQQAQTLYTRSAYDLCCWVGYVMLGGISEQRRQVTAILPATSCFRYKSNRRPLVLFFRCSRKFHRIRRASGVYQ